jgi:hypothetical protein
VGAEPPPKNVDDNEKRGIFVELICKESLLHTCTLWLVLRNRLDLDAWINQPESDSSEDEATSGVGFFSTIGGGGDEHRSTYQVSESKPTPELSPEEMEKVCVC